MRRTLGAVPVSPVLPALLTLLFAGPAAGAEEARQQHRKESMEREYGTALTPAEARGQDLYFTGTSPSGEPITARIGTDGLELPGEAARCSGCHGHDGIGRPEGGVLPSDVTWAHLTRSYGHVHEGGIEHPPFDEASMGRYLRTGIFPGGGAGDPSMPRYQISDRDLADLVSYLKRVGTLPDPGVGESRVRIGTLVPHDGELGEMGRTIVEVLEAVFEELNRAGGIYGRELELVVGDAGVVGDPEALRAWLAAEEPFALLSPFLPGADPALQEVLADEGLSVIGPFSLESTRSFTLSRNVFHLLPGLEEQVEVLLRHAQEDLGLVEPGAVVLIPRSGSASEALLGRVFELGERAGWPALRAAVFPGSDPANPNTLDAVRGLRDDGVEVVISLGLEAELRPFLEAAAALDWHPWVLAPGMLSGSLLFDSPEGAREHLYLAYPTLPRDREPGALADFMALLDATDTARTHPQVAIAAYCAARVLAEALRRTGRHLGRREMTAELERFYRFETGLIPAITFTANRRVGVRGAYVLNAVTTAAEGGAPDGVWIDLDRRKNAKNEVLPVHGGRASSRRKGEP